MMLVLTILAVLAVVAIVVGLCWWALYALASGMKD